MLTLVLVFLCSIFYFWCGHTPQQRNVGLVTEYFSEEPRRRLPPLTKVHETAERVWFETPIESFSELIEHLTPLEDNITITWGPPVENSTNSWGHAVANFLNTVD